MIRDLLLDPKDLEEFMAALVNQIVSGEKKISELEADLEKTKEIVKNYKSKLELLKDWKIMLENDAFAEMRLIIEDFKKKLEQKEKVESEQNPKPS